MTRRSTRNSSGAGGALAVFLIVAAVAAAAQMLQHALVQVLAAVAIAAAGYGLGRRSRTGQPRPPRGAQTRAELARLRAEVAELEHAAGRPLTTITASYRHIQRQYRAGGGR